MLYFVKSELIMTSYVLIRAKQKKNMKNLPILTKLSKHFVANSWSFADHTIA